MAGYTDLAETDWLDHFFTNTTFPTVGDATGLLASAAPGVFDCSINTGDTLTDASTLLTEAEASYTGYSRPTIVRGTGAWTVTGDTVTNDNLIVFGEMSAGGPVTITDVGLGFAAGNVLQLWGQVTTDLVVNNGVNPQLAAGALDVTAD